MVWFCWFLFNVFFLFQLHIFMYNLFMSNKNIFISWREKFAFVFHATIQKYAINYPCMKCVMKRMSHFYSRKRKDMCILCVVFSLQCTIIHDQFAVHNLNMMMAKNLSLLYGWMEYGCVCKFQWACIFRCMRVCVHFIIHRYD